MSVPHTILSTFMAIFAQKKYQIQSKSDEVMTKAIFLLSLKHSI